MAGFKTKTRKAAAKRFRKATATGKIIRSKGHHGHFLSKRGQKARLNTGTTYVSDANFEQANALVPALGAKRKRSKAIKNALRKATETKSAAAKPLNRFQRNTAKKLAAKAAAPKKAATAAKAK